MRLGPFLQAGCIEMSEVVKAGPTEVHTIEGSVGAGSGGEW